MAILSEALQARYDYLKSRPEAEMDIFRERELRKLERMIQHGETEAEARKKVQQNG